VQGLMTHFADADNIENEYTDMQSTRFNKALEYVREAGITPKWIHAGQSAASFKQDIPEVNMIRTGLSMYGITSFDETDEKAELLHDLYPAMEVTSTLVNIRRIHAGDTVSYSRKFTAEKDMTIGIVSFGYYEGMPRCLTNRGVVTIRGLPCPIVGNVCMNYTLIDLSGVSHPKVGETVVIYSRDKNDPNSVAKIAALANTSPHEVMVRIAESIRRVVV